MRCLALLLLLAAPLLAQDPPKPAAPAPAPAVDSDVYQWPLWLDATYEWRVQRGGGWQNADLLLTTGLDNLMGRRDQAWHAHKATFGARYEQGYGRHPNGQRAGVVWGYAFGHDDGSGSTMQDFPNLAREGFPFQRSSWFSVVGGVAAGWMHARATQGEQGRRVETQDALRLEQYSYFSFFGFGFRQQAALNFNLRDGPAMDWEAGAWLVIGRPLLPFSLSLGYVYLGLEHGGGGSFSLRAGVHF